MMLLEFRAGVSRTADWGAERGSFMSILFPLLLSVLSIVMVTCFCLSADDIE